jgi:hypothetical protein
LCNFAEKHSFILQVEEQVFHCNKAQPTIHPFVIYFEKSDALNTEHETLVMLLNCLKHDFILEHTFQQHLMKLTENTFESPLKKKNVSFTDVSTA